MALHLMPPPYRKRLSSRFACGVIKAITLHEEAIRVRTSPPSATHVRAYIAVVYGELSGAQPLTSDGEEEPQLSHSDPNPGGRTPHQLQANLGDLADDELWWLMEDLCWKVTLSELNTPLETHCQHLGEIQWEMRILMWITWKSPFQEEEGGNPRTTTLIPCPPQPDGGWEPRGQSPWSPAPTQCNEDVGCLINTLAMWLQLGIPCINTFSSEAMPGKTVVLFKQWYHEVQCIEDH